MYAPSLGRRTRRRDWVDVNVDEKNLEKEKRRLQPADRFGAASYLLACVVVVGWLVG